MALPMKRFNGELGGVTIYDMKKELDYSIDSQKERLELVERIVNDENGLPNDYFKDFFEQKTEDGVNKSHFKVNITKSELLSHKHNVCQEIEKIADYILFAPDAKPLTMKTTHRFYTDALMEQKLNREQSLEGIAKKVASSTTDEFDGDVTGEVIDFLVRKGQNYKVEAKQKIYAKDMHDEELGVVKDYEDFINHLKEKIQEIKDADGDRKLIYAYAKHIGLCVQDQLMAKDMIKRTIYFKFPEDSPEEPDILTHFNFTDMKQVKALLKAGKRSMKSDIGHLAYDLSVLLAEIDLSDRDKEILELWAEEDSTEETIAVHADITQQRVNEILNRISRQVIKKYKEKYIDNAFMNYFKGTYKQCRKCGEIKIIQHFDKERKGKHGVKAVCKSCR